MSKRLILAIAVAVMFLSSAGLVTVLSAQEGVDIPAATAATGPGGVAASTAATGPAGGPVAAPRASAPPDAQPVALESRYSPDRIYRTPAGSIWRVSRQEGVLVSTDGGATWFARNEALPMRAVYPFAENRPPIITGLSVDPSDATRVAITTLDTLFLSSDAGATWQKVELKEPIKSNDQLTCVSLAPGNAGGILIGTSFHGFFQSLDRGASWTSLSEPLTALQLGGGTYEEIAAIAGDPIAPDLIWFSLGFGKGLYTFRRGTNAVQQVPFPPGENPDIRSISFDRLSAREPWYLDVRTDDARWMYTPGLGSWKKVEKIQPEVAVPPDKAARTIKASGRYGIYVSSHFASGEKLKAHIAFLKAEGLNSMVVDFKDDDGWVTYDTALSEPKRIRAVRERFKIDELVKAAHDSGLYLIGRIVTFRDKQLYNADGYRWAAWDAAAKAPWRYLKKTVDDQTGEETLYQGEYWVDPYSEYVWDYNIGIAKEMQDHGVDEVQFDYIRFPSDGNVDGITWRYRRPNMGKLEALESFLAKARASLVFPISTDVYGYAAWARVASWVAQNIETFSRYVDVIQPMFYPSHFPRDFLGSMDYLPRAEYIYEEGTRRAAYIVEGRSIVRPFVQSFRLGGELSFAPAVYSTYLVNQVEGSLAGAGSGFTLWNASNDYYMVKVPLGPIIEKGLAMRASR
jgi:hypothetical protein